jgi:hypothetical protein
LRLAGFRQSEGAVVVNLGPRDAVAEMMTQWLSAIDFGERPCS